MAKNFSREELTFSDILLLPGKASIEMAEEGVIELQSKLTKKIGLKIPIVSANMMNVTESEMAIVMAKAGGIGIIHEFMDEDRQIDEVRRVKDLDLPVGAAVFSFGDKVKKQIKALKKIGCDVIVIDSANAYNDRVLRFVKEIKKEMAVELIVGNVVSGDATRDLIKAGADGVKVGIGPGSHCTTRVVTGFGRPQLSAIIECSSVAKRFGTPVIADGGISSSGDAVKALALGASTVMIGGMFSGTEQSPGRKVRENGRVYKESWGNCTKEALQREDFSAKLLKNTKNLIKTLILGSPGLKKEEILEEGIGGLFEYKGDAQAVINKLVEGIRRGLWYGGARNIKELQKITKYVRVSAASLEEAKPRILNLEA